MGRKRRINVEDLPPFDAAPYLASEDAIAAYFTAILDANDAELLEAALGEIARARGLTEIAKAGEALKPSATDARSLRRMSVDQMLSFGADIAALPLLDSRSACEIMDDLNEP